MQYQQRFTKSSGYGHQSNTQVSNISYQSNDNNYQNQIYNQDQYQTRIKNAQQYTGNAVNANYQQAVKSNVASFDVSPGGAVGVTQSFEAMFEARKGGECPFGFEIDWDRDINAKKLTVRKVQITSEAFQESVKRGYRLLRVGEVTSFE
eukprot:UN28677